MTDENVKTLNVQDVRFVKELYPRMKPHDDVVEQYRDAVDELPPIVVARDGVLVDGYHRWQAFVREERETIPAVDLGNLTDAEISRESIRRNASHGQQLTQKDKKNVAGKLWTAFADLPQYERVKSIASILSVAERTVQGWTKEERQEEKRQTQDKAWDLWLDCYSEQAIADELGGDVDRRTVNNWVGNYRKDAQFSEPPESRQHFDIWQFQATDKEGGGQQSYFGALPPQVVENLLWFYTEPGEIVTDPFAGSGTVLDVAKRMGRRVFASDIQGNKYSPHLTIHEHDITQGWPDNAPKSDLVILDPPYWKQASGKYSANKSEMAEMDYDAFMEAWQATVKAVCAKTKRAAYIISPTQNEDGSVVDHATDMLQAFKDQGWSVERRIIVPYSTQQATGQQVTWARENKRMLKLYRDLVVVSL